MALYQRTRLHVFLIAIFWKIWKYEYEKYVLIYFMTSLVVISIRVQLLWWKTAPGDRHRLTFGLNNNPTCLLTADPFVSHFLPPSQRGFGEARPELSSSLLCTSSLMQGPLQTFVTVILFSSYRYPPCPSHARSVSNWIHRSEFQWAAKKEGVKQLMSGVKV